VPVDNNDIEVLNWLGCYYFLDRCDRILCTGNKWDVIAGNVVPSLWLSHATMAANPEGPNAASIANSKKGINKETKTTAT